MLYNVDQAIAPFVYIPNINNRYEIAYIKNMAMLMIQI